MPSFLLLMLLLGSSGPRSARAQETSGDGVIYVEITGEPEAPGPGEARGGRRPQGAGGPGSRSGGRKLPHEYMDEILEEFYAKQEAGDRALQAFEELETRYAGTGPLGALEEERGAARKPARALRGDIERLAARYDIHLQRFRSGPRPPENAPDFSAPLKNMREYAASLKTALERDEEVYAARAAIESVAAPAIIKTPAVEEPVLEPEAAIIKAAEVSEPAFVPSAAAVKTAEVSKPAPKPAPAPPGPQPPAPSTPVARVAAGLAGAAGVAGLFLFGLKKTIQTTVLDATRAATDTLPATTPAPAARPAAAASGEEPGSVIGGNFRVVSTLGEGGMGIVYLAEDLALGRTVAVKRMRDNLVASRKALASFLNEARLVAGLRHRNIVEIHQILETPGRAYLVFEYVEGRNLAMLLDQFDRLGLPLCNSLLWQVAAALDYAHSKRIIHRDLKPANIVVDRKGVAKVMDFGVAHESSKTAARTTQAGFSGTLAYMAPEQEMGSAARASDVFSLGVCAYEMLTGKLPFEGPNFLAQKLEISPEPPSRLAAGLPPEIDAVVERALRPDPKKRFPTAGDFARAFRRIADTKRTA